MPRKGTNIRRTNKKDGDWEVVKPTSSSKKGRKTFNFFENRSTHHTGASSKEKLPELSYSPPSPKTEKPSPPCTLSGHVKVENQTSTAKKGRKTFVCLEDKSTHEAFSNEKIVSDGELSDDDVIDHSVCCADVGDLTDDEEDEPMHDHSKCCGVDRFWDRTSFSPHIPYIPSVTDVIVPPPRPVVEEPSSPPPHPDSMMKLLAEEYLTDKHLSELPPGVAEIMKEVREKIKAELDLKEREKNDG